MANITINEMKLEGVTKFLKIEYVMIEGSPAGTLLHSTQQVWARTWDCTDTSSVLPSDIQTQLETKQIGNADGALSN